MKSYQFWLLDNFIKTNISPPWYLSCAPLLQMIFLGHTTWHRRSWREKFGVKTNRDENHQGYFKKGYPFSNKIPGLQGPKAHTSILDWIQGSFSVFTNQTRFVERILGTTDVLHPKKLHHNHFAFVRFNFIIEYLAISITYYTNQSLCIN